MTLVLKVLKVLQVRRSDIVKEDGVVVGTSFHRHVVVPGDDVTAEATVVQLIAGALHDEATVAAYQATSGTNQQSTPESY